MAICCICEATDTFASFTQDFEDTFSKLKAVREKPQKGLATRLWDQLVFMQRMKTDGPNPSNAAGHATVQLNRIQDLANTVTTSQKQHVHELRHAYRSAISGYNAQLDGNCFYWLHFLLPEEGVTARPDDIQHSSITEGTEAGADKQGPAWPPLSVVMLAAVTFLAGVALGGHVNKQQPRVAELK